MLLSVREGGLSYLDAIGFAGDWVCDRKIGIDLLSLRSCALVVVGSLRRAVMEGFCANSFRRRGVDGGNECAEDGVVGVGRLVMDDCEEWPPSLDWERLERLRIGPPLSDTGSRCDGTLSWPSGRGNLEALTGGEGLLVKVSETAVFGRTGLVVRTAFTLMLRFRLSLLESKTSPSPISRPDRKSSFIGPLFGAGISMGKWPGD